VHRPTTSKQKNIMDAMFHKGLGDIVGNSHRGFALRFANLVDIIIVDRL